MKKTVVVIRNGEVKLTIPNATIRSDGTVWTAKNDNPLIDGESARSKHEGKEKLAALIKARKSEEIPLACIAKYGHNESGLLVVDKDEYYAEKRAKAEREMTPAQRERIEIQKLYAKANKIANSESEDNVSKPMAIRSKADKKLADWRKKYPVEAAKEKAADLRAKADHERDLARGALLYDADGWLSKEDQQKRHDEHIAKATELEKQATELETK